MASFKYLKKGNKVYVSFAEGRILIPWNERWVPAAESITILPTSVALDASTATLEISKTKSLVATVSPNNASDKTVIWSSSDTTIATVSNAGLVTAVKEGSATITCACNADKSVKATCAVTVNPKVLSSIAVTTQPTKTTYALNEDLDLTGMVVTATYSNDSTAAVTDYTTSGYDKTQAGEQTITVSYTEGSVTKTTTFTVTVVE